MKTSLEMVSKILAQENLVIDWRHTKTASFDLESRILTLPVWTGFTDEAIEMFMMHEVSHALFTPQKEWMEFVRKEPQFHHILNVVEDVRIERLFKIKYPGARRTFVQGYTDVEEKVQMGSDDIMSMNLVDAINVYHKVGHIHHYQPKGVYKKFIDLAGKTETFEDVISLTNDIIKFLRLRVAKPKSPVDDFADFIASLREGKLEELEEIELNSEEDEETQGSDSNDDERIKPELPKNRGNEEKWEDIVETIESRQEFGQGPSSEKGSESNADQGPGAEPVALSENEEEKTNEEKLEDYFEELDRLNVPEEETISSFQQKVNELQESAIDKSIKDIVRVEYSEDYVFDGPEKNIDFVSFKKFYDKIDQDGWMLKDSIIKRSAKYRSQTKKQVDVLVQNFQLKKAAERYALRERGVSGRINPSRLAQYKVKDDIFLRYNKEKKAKNHGLLMLLDWSGSMTSHDKFENSLNQCLQLGQFCREVGIPFRIYGIKEAGRFNMKNDKNHMGSRLSLLEILSSEMNAKEFVNAIGVLSDYRNLMRSFDLRATPLLAGILAMRKFVPEFQAKEGVEKTILITFTDGENSFDDQEVSQARRSISNQLIIKDPVTNIEYVNRKFVDSWRVGHDYGDTTSIALQMLRQRYGVKVVSFFLSNHTPNLNDLCLNGFEYTTPDADVIKVQDEFRKNRFAKISDLRGRDTMFYVYTRVLERVAGSDINQLSEDSSAAEIAGALKKAAKASIKSKFLLEKFIETIA